MSSRSDEQIQDRAWGGAPIQRGRTTADEVEERLILAIARGDKAAVRVPFGSSAGRGAREQLFDHRRRSARAVSTTVTVL